MSPTIISLLKYFHSRSWSKLFFSFKINKKKIYKGNILPIVGIFINFIFILFLIFSSKNIIKQKQAQRDIFFSPWKFFNFSKKKIGMKSPSILDTLIGTGKLIETSIEKIWNLKYGFFKCQKVVFFSHILREKNTKMLLINTSTLLDKIISDGQHFFLSSASYKHALKIFVIATDRNNTFF